MKINIKNIILFFILIIIIISQFCNLREGATNNCSELQERNEELQKKNNSMQSTISSQNSQIDSQKSQIDSQKQTINNNFCQNALDKLKEYQDTTNKTLKQLKGLLS